MSYIIPKEKNIAFDNYFNQDHCYLEDYHNTNTENIRIKGEITQNYDEMESCCDTSSDKERNENSHIISKGQETNQNSKNIGSQKIIYLPLIESCTEHEDLLLVEDKRLVKPGDKFKTHKDFVHYLNENAKRWFYYYKCSDSRKPNTEQEMYLYTCVYLRNKGKYVKKGLRKRNSNHKTNCPCKIKLRHLPHEKELTVVFVCNHHDHPLSEEEFYKLQHGRRLPPYIKEEIMDLLTLKVDMTKIKKYVQITTGFNMSRAFFYTIERILKSRHEKRHISDERVRELIKRLRENSIFDSVQNNSNNNVSEDRINESETLQSVRNLQESVKCETQHNPWICDQHVPVLSNGDLSVLVTTNGVLDTVENHNKYEGCNIEMVIPGSFQCHEITECNVQEFETSEDSCMAYETVISRTENDSEHDGDDISENVYSDLEQYYDQIDENKNDNEVNPANDNIVNAVNEIVEYINDDTEIVESNLSNNVNDCIYKDNERDSNNHCDEEIVEYEVVYDNCNEAKEIEVQHCDSISKQNTFASVFDVCMKDGNVTGFIVHNEVLNQLKNDRVEKGVQTDEINNSDTQSEDASDTEANSDGYIELKSDGTYIKQEYVHKFNIDKYMCRPCFPKYIEVLSKKTGIEVLEMFTNVYNERAMFKLTTTQRDKEGNTRILYVTDPPGIPHDVNMKKRWKLGKDLKEVLFLKDKVKTLEMKNSELTMINQQLITSLR